MLVGDGRGFRGDQERTFLLWGTGLGDELEKGRIFMWSWLYCFFMNSYFIGRLLVNFSLDLPRSFLQRRGRVLQFGLLSISWDRVTKVCLNIDLSVLPFYCVGMWMSLWLTDEVRSLIDFYFRYGYWDFLLNGLCLWLLYFSLRLLMSLMFLFHLRLNLDILLLLVLHYLRLFYSSVANLNAGGMSQLRVMPNNALRLGVWSRYRLICHWQWK